MRRLLRICFLVGACACARTVVGPEVSVAPPTGSVAMVAAAGTDLRIESAMSIAWQHPTSFKPWAAAGDSIMMLAQTGGQIDVLDPRSGHPRSFPIGETPVGLIGTSGPMVMATTQNRVLALDPTGGILWSIGIPRASTISQAVPISSGVLLFVPVDDKGYPSLRVMALARNDGSLLWGLPLPPSFGGSTLVRLGTNVLLWSTASGLVRWSVLDETNGKTIAQGEESGTRLLARGRKFVVCDERQEIVRIHATGSEASNQVAARGRCTEMAIDDDTIYAMKGHEKEKEKEPDQIEAIAMTDGARRWLQKVPVQVGSVVHGPWLLVPSDGGMVRALRRDTGAIAWTNGVGERATLFSFDESTVIASGNRTITALRTTTTTLPAERTSEVSLHVTSWGCVDRENTQLFVGDVPAQSEGGDRFTARIHGRGRVVVRVTPWGDILPSRSEGNDWSYGPVLVEIDGARHALDIELDNCDED